MQKTKISEISKAVHKICEPIYLAGNESRDMIEENEIYLKLKETEIYAELNSKRRTRSEVFDDLHEYIDSL